MSSIEKDSQKSTQSKSSQNRFILMCQIQSAKVISDVLTSMHFKKDQVLYSQLSQYINIYSGQFVNSPIKELNLQ